MVREEFFLYWYECFWAEGGNVPFCRHMKIVTEEPCLLKPTAGSSC